MSSLQTWLRQNLSWSNSPQAWAERVATLALVAGFAWAIWFGTSLPGVHQLFIWAVLLLATAILLRRGWFMLFGPVLFYDMVRNARRSHFVWIRCLYAGLLLFILATYFLPRWGHDLQNRYTAGTLAKDFFETFMIVQLIAVGLLTPAFVAGSIAEEKERKTLEFLLATDLRNREIVLSKLGSRLANLVLFLLTGLPILCLLQFLGGVDPNLVLAGYAVTGLTMLSIAAVSIFASTQFKRPRDAIAISYLFVLTYFAISFLALALKSWYPAVTAINLWTETTPFLVADLIDAFNKGNVIILVAEVSMMARGSGGLADTLPLVLRGYAIFHGIAAALLIFWAVTRLRIVALRQATGPARRRLHIIRFGSRPKVGMNPMLWKEVHAEGAGRLNLFALALVVLLIGLTVFPVVLILYHDSRNFYEYRGPWNSLAQHTSWWVRIAGTIVASLTLLSVAVRASTAISSERDRQTFDALLTTPMDSTPMLFAKWIGSICSVRLAWLWLAAIWGVGIVTGGLDLLALPFLLVAWFVYAAFLATLGLWFSLVCKTSMRATVLTILMTLVVTVGHWLPWMCCAPLGMRFEESMRYLAKFQAGLTPPAALAFLQFPIDELRRDKHMAEFVGFSVFGLFIWAVATGVLWSVLSMRFRIVTKRAARLRSEQSYAPRRPRPVRLERWDEPSPRPLEPPRRSTEPIVLEEVWDDPPDDEEQPPRRR